MAAGLPKRQADAKRPIVGCVPGEGARIDVVAKFQSETHSLKNPIVDAAAKVEEIRRWKWIVIAESASVPAFNKRDELCATGGAQEMVRGVDRKHRDPFCGPAHRSKFTTHGEPFIEENFSAPADLRDAAQAVVSKRAFPNEYVALASILSICFLCLYQNRYY